MQKIKGFVFRDKFSPWLFLVLSLLAYGLFSSKIGYYMDDWYLIWFKHTFGAIDYIQYFKSDRPLMGYFFVVANFILGGAEKPLVWQLFGILTRWLVDVSLWQMLNTIWPGAKKQNLWVALLAVVFPGFTQQWIAVVYSFFFTCLAGFFFSITLMFKAIRTPRRFWLYYIGSILLMAYVIPASEFFVGLELIRVLILWFEFGAKNVKGWQRVKKTMALWFPFAVIYALFLVWRIFFFTSFNHSLGLSSVFSGGFVQIVTSNAARVYQAIVDAIINSWSNPFNLSNYPASGTVPYLILALVFLVLAALLIWQKNTLSQLNADPQNQLNTWQKQAPILAIFSLILAIIPFLSADLTVGYLYPNDRFLLAYMLGSCLLLVWIVEAVGKNEWKSIIIVSVLVSIAMGYQIANANQYKNLWSMQKTFLWQVYWRMPSIKEDTALIAYQLPDTEYWSGNALSSELDWTYSPSIQNRKTNYLFLLLNSGQKTLLPDILQANQPIQMNFRTYTFSGNTSQSIFVYYTTDGCMRVLDSKVTPPSSVMDNLAASNLNMEDPRIHDTLSGSGLTNLSLISTATSQKGTPPTDVLGSEPFHDWCYYFEKADLARQSQDYTQIVILFNQANQKGLSSKNGSEYYPFIEALARTGNWDDAAKLTLKWQPITSPALQNGMCSLWQELSKSYPKESTPAKVISSLNCTS